MASLRGQAASGPARAPGDVRRPMAGRRASVRAPLSGRTPSPAAAPSTRRQPSAAASPIAPSQLTSPPSTPLVEHYVTDPEVLAPGSVDGALFDAERSAIELLAEAEAACAGLEQVLEWPLLPAAAPAAAGPMPADVSEMRRTADGMYGLQVGGCVVWGLRTWGRGEQWVGPRGPCGRARAAIHKRACRHAPPRRAVDLPRVAADTRADTPRPPHLPRSLPRSLPASPRTLRASRRRSWPTARRARSRRRS